MGVVRSILRGWVGRVDCCLYGGRGAVVGAEVEDVEELDIVMRGIEMKDERRTEEGCDRAERARSGSERVRVSR